ncbi:hypothetical protein D3C80_1933880 [compost metagenome]
MVNPMTAEPYIGRGLKVIPFKPAIYFRTLLVLPPNRHPSRIVADFVEEVMRYSLFQN